MSSQISFLNLGTEPLTIRWTHDKVEVQDSVAFRYRRSGKSACLLINDPFPEDSGEYVCSITNKFGTAKAHIDLTVIGKLFKALIFISLPFAEQVKSPLMPMLAPKLKALHDGLILVELKQSVQLKVVWTGKPEPVISWSKGANKIQPNQRLETIVVGDTFVLVINEVCSAMLLNKHHMLVGSKTGRRQLYFDGRQ